MYCGQRSKLVFRSQQEVDQMFQGPVAQNLLSLLLECVNMCVSVAIVMRCAAFVLRVSTTGVILI